MRAVLDIDAPDEFPILTMIEGISRINEKYLRDNPNTPALYESGVKYAREGSPEQWFDIPNILRRGEDDCEGLAGWRCAECRVAGFDSDPVLKRFERDDGSVLYHCITEIHMPDGRVVLDDPSARLGMFDRSGGKVTGLPETERAVRHWKPLPSRTSNTPRAADRPGAIEVVRLATFQQSRGEQDGPLRVRSEPTRPEVRMAVANLGFGYRASLAPDEDVGAILSFNPALISSVTARPPALRSASTGAALPSRIRRLPRSQ